MREVTGLRDRSRAIGAAMEETIRLTADAAKMTAVSRTNVRPDYAVTQRNNNGSDMMQGALRAASGAIQRQGASC